MNIITRPYGSSSCYCRPDTTWEREDKDFYVPDSVEVIYWAPVVFARISKAGKCIGRKFASRYYDGFGFGALLYCNDGPVAFTSCADHTSRLPFPLNGPDFLEEGKEYSVTVNGETVFTGVADRALIEETICMASGTTSLRIGDFVAVEMGPVRPLASKKDQEARIEGRLNGEATYGFKLIF